MSDAHHHRLLLRQIKKHLGSPEDMPEPLQRFIAAVDEAYRQFDDDREMVERSLELSSQELLHSNAALRAVFSAFTDTLYCWINSDNVVTRHTAGFAQHLGQAQGSLAGRPLLEAPQRDLAILFAHALRRVRQRGKHVTIEYANASKGGDRSYEARLAPSLNNEIIVIVRDITDQKRAETALKRALDDTERQVSARTAELTQSNQLLLQEVLDRKMAETKLAESEERFRKITAAAHDGIIMVDDAGRISFWNNGATSILGFSVDEAMGKDAHGLLRPFKDAKPLHNTSLWGASNATGMEPGRTLDLTVSNKQGTSIAVEVSISSAAIKGRWHTVAIIRDVTARKEAEETLQNAKRAAEEANQIKSDFLSMVSHELRTPLTAVLGFAKMIKKRLVDTVRPKAEAGAPVPLKALGQMEANIAVIVSEGERLTELINNVLDLAKLEAGRFEWSMRPLGLDSVIEQSLNATAILFRDKNLRLVRDVPADLPHVQGDKDRLVQVCINLLSNAAKFSSHGTVYVSVRRSVDNLVVCVRDEGVGIREEDNQAVFDKFKQLGDTLTDKPKGTGLGLPISKEIVEHHGGSMWVESAQGQGSAFYFSLPIL
ncbi:MAG: ATP-binding protein [Desulfovibrionaceae bacterium]